jgi:tetratricopeptide (TPR) repeat protein/tRNA A-37 threonylcarbamoyl transferase component Bud32
MIGKTISHYRVVEKLGEGGMGVVYVAEDTLLGRRVAIKMLTIKAGQDEHHFRTRFLREARAVSALSHPHIATIHDYGETKRGQPYIVMELVKGETLGDVMASGSLTITRALQIIQQVAAALAEAHRNGVVHRDIKPSNVAIDHRGDVKVLDFGLAKQLNVEAKDSTDPERQTLLTSQTQEGVIVGTPLYLSPEQALGTEIDARSDIFALGSLLYECVAGRPAFDGDTRMEICTKVIRDDPVLPSQINSDVPQAVDRITMKALAKQPAQRYQTATELVADLDTALSASGIASRAVPRITSPADRNRPTGTLATFSDIFRRPRISVGYVIAGVAIALLIGFAIWYVVRPKPYEPKPAAKRLYDQAVDALRQGAFFKSSKILQQAVLEDDRFALAHARLAEADMELDNSDNAKDELIRANDLAKNIALPKVDSIRLQAITDTVKRDFAAAAENYRQLADMVPDSEKAFALVDLGRAYEKYDKPVQAIGSFRDATQRDPRYASAFLRLGVALRRNQKFAEAEAALAQASDLFSIANEVEGTTEVLIQRGLLLSQQGKLVEAQAELQRALERSLTLDNHDQQIRALQQLSNTSIMAGDAAKARGYSQKATQLAQANGMENLTTAGLLEIGNSYFIKGDFVEAEKNFNEALRLAQLYKGRFNEARAMLSLASLRVQQDNPDAARDYAQKALSFFQQGSYGNQTGTAFLIIGRAYDATGDYENAEKTFQQLLVSAQQVGDSRSVTLAHEGLGSVYLHTDRVPEALAHFEEEYKLATTNNARLAAGYSMHYQALAWWRLGKYDEAQTQLTEALSAAQPEGRKPYKELLAEVTWSQAAMELSRNNSGQAAVLAKKAFDLAGSEYKAIAVRAGATLCVAQSRSGQIAAARKRCEEAVSLARTIRDSRSLTDALIASAAGAIAAGDAPSGLQQAPEAAERCAASKQVECEWWSRAVQARASEMAGNRVEARELSSRAQELLSSLESKWGSDYFKSFLARGDVDELRRQILALSNQ